MRFTLGMLLTVFVSLNTAWSQPTIDGPKTVKPGGMKQLLVKLDEGDDLKKVDMKVAGFINGKQSNENWNIFKSLDDQPIIMLTPQKDSDEGKVFTFVVSINKGGKTFQLVHEVEIEGAPKPPPKPPVDPNVVPNDLQGKLQAAYDAAKSPQNLAKYKEVWDALVAQKFAKYGEFEVALVATTKKFMPDGGVQPLKDAVTAHLLSKIGDDPRQTDMTKLKSALDEVVTALKGVKE